MKVTSILRWPDSDFLYYQREWVYNLSDGILKEERINIFEKFGRKCEEWNITISDEDACLLRLRFPKIKFI
jgi:hypothetical protein